MSWRARLVLGLLIAFGILCLVMGFAHSQAMPRCEPGSNLPAFLMSQFGERPVMEATMPGGAKLFVLMAANGSVSVIACDKTKCCFRAVGTDAKFLAPGA